MPAGTKLPMQFVFKAQIRQNTKIVIFAKFKLFVPTSNAYDKLLGFVNNSAIHC